MTCKIMQVSRPDNPLLEDQYLVVHWDHGGIALIAHMLTKNIVLNQSIWSNSTKGEPDA